MQFNFVECTYRAIESKLAERNLDEFIPNRKNKTSLKQYFQILEGLSLKQDDGYISYTLLNNHQKHIVKEAAKCLSEYCAYKIHQRFLELGYDNYSFKNKKYTPTTLEQDLRVKGLDHLFLKLNELRNSHRMIDETKRSIGFKARPFTLNDEVISAIFRADPIINRQVGYMLMTVYGFLYKKSLDLGRNIPVERAGVDNQDLMNSGTIGYLSAAIIWNPYINECNRSSFVSFGWEFAIRYFRKAMMSSRIVRFPSHIEELIYKVHRQIRNRRIELLNESQPRSYSEIEKILALEFKTDIEKIRDIFAMFESPSSALGNNLPSEQRLIRLDKRISNDSDYMTYEDKVQTQEHINSIDEIYSIELIEQIQFAMRKLYSKESVIMRLRFGFPITPRLWQDSGLKKKTKLPWTSIEHRTYSLAEIGSFFDLTRERVRVIEAGSLRKLRHPLVNKSLKQFIRHDYMVKQTPVIDDQQEVTEPTLRIGQIKLLDTMDQLKFFNLTGSKVPPTNPRAVAQELDKITKLDKISMEELLRSCISIITDRLFNLSLISLPFTNLETTVINALKSEKYDLGSPGTNANITNTVGLLLYYAHNLTSKYPLLKDKQKKDFQALILYLKDYPSILVNLI